MATILVVQDSPEGLLDQDALAARGHLLRRCWGGATMFAGCPMLKTGACPLPLGADLIVFAPGFLNAPIAHRTYRGIHVLNGYRRHAIYSTLPMLLVSFDDPGPLPGTGPIEVIEPFTQIENVLTAIDRLIARSLLAPL